MFNGQEFLSGGTSEADCFAKASAACLADDTCSAFAYDAKAMMYETFTVGLANVVANSDWCAPPSGARLQP